jgi:hypothetical protein
VKTIKLIRKSKEEKNNKAKGPKKIKSKAMRDNKEEKKSLKIKIKLKNKIKNKLSKRIKFKIKKES